MADTSAAPMAYRIDGPFPLTVRATSNGAALDVSAFLIRAVFAELFRAADDDPQGFGEDFADMYALHQSAQMQGRGSHARHEFDERMNEFVDMFADGGTIPLYAGALHQLLEAVKDITAPRPVPGQREAGAA